MTNENEPFTEGENQLIKANHYLYGEVLVDRDDVILRHSDARYDHVRIHSLDEEQNINMGLFFIEEPHLEHLAELGIPEAFLDKPTPCTVALYGRDFIMRMECTVEWNEDE